MGNILTRFQEFADTIDHSILMTTFVTAFDCYHIFKRALARAPHGLQKALELARWCDVAV